MKRISKSKKLEKIMVDRKIVEGLISGRSLTYLTKQTGKGKGYVIKVRDKSVELGYIKLKSQVGEKQKVFIAGEKQIPSFPEALFPFTDGRSEKLAETDLALVEKFEWIKERLESGWSPQTIFEEIGLSVPRSNFYRYLHRQNLLTNFRPTRNVIELIHLPGECLQVDWGKLFDVVDHLTKKKKTIWVFVGVLGHSRFEMARVVECLNFETTIKVLISMFEELGGVPAKVTSDNPKVFVRQASAYEPLLNPGFERFASAYGFRVEALPPASPEKKGKVERRMPVMRRLFESYEVGSYNFETAGEHIARKLTLTNERKHGAHQQRPIDVFLNDEAQKLKPLPALRYETEQIVSVTVRDDGYVRFENKFYRIDTRLKKESALVIGNSSQVSIYVNGRLLEVYDRVTDKFTTKACKDHYKESWEKTLQDHGHYLTRAGFIGSDVERFVTLVLARGEGFVDTRVIWGLLSLDKTYEKVDINKACKSALELSELNIKTIRSLLNIMAKPKKNKISVINDIDGRNTSAQRGGKFARPMSEYSKHLKLVHSKP